VAGFTPATLLSFAVNQPECGKSPADAANVLFRVVSIRHLKRRSTIVTTNKPLAALGQVLHDADLAEAILDRLLERGTHYVLRGRSYRTRNFKEDLSQTTELDAA